MHRKSVYGQTVRRSSAAILNVSEFTRAKPSRRPEVLVILNATFEECERMLRGVAEYLQQHEPWQIYLESSGNTEENLAAIVSRSWDGVLCRCTNQQIVDACQSRSIPLVDLNDCEAFSGVPKVRPDNRAIGHMAAEELHGRGYQHLYYCGYQNQLWSQERHFGFVEAGRLLGAEVREHLTLHAATLTPKENADMIQQLAVWLKTLKLPAGIFAAHDLRGRQLLSAASVAGLHVPDEIAVLGANNEQARCELCTPPLASIATDCVRSGSTAAEMLARLMRGEPVSPSTHRIEPVAVVTRRSIDGFAIPDRTISAAVALIRAEACNKLTIADVMRRLSVSRNRLEHGFRRFLNSTPQAEIRRVRIQNVKRLLTETDLPLREIALHSGFEYVEYLNVSFKRTVGMTPGKYRRMERGELPTEPAPDLEVQPRPANPKASRKPAPSALTVAA